MVNICISVPSHVRDLMLVLYTSLAMFVSDLFSFDAQLCITRLCTIQIGARLSAVTCVI